MARNDLLVVGVLIACCIAGGSSTFADDNPIRQVVDGLHDLETSILQIVGNSRRALSFARFAHRSVNFIFQILAVCSINRDFPC